MSCQQRAKTSDAELSAWLKSVLAVKPGGKHPDLGKIPQAEFWNRVRPSQLSPLWREAGAGEA